MRLTGRNEMTSLPFRYDFLIFVFTAIFFFIKLNRLKIPFISIIEFDDNHRAYLWECYEMVSGSYILISLLLYLDSGHWIIETDSHWFILIFPGLARRILKYLRDCGVFGEHSQALTP